MSQSEKQYSMRDIVMAKREGFARAHAGAQIHDYHAVGPCRICERSREIARETYPLTVTQPRIVKDADGFAWRVIDGRLEYRAGISGEWNDDNTAIIRPRDVLRIADLFSNPTETISDG